MKPINRLFIATFLVIGSLCSLQAQFTAKWRCPICRAYYHDAEYERHLRTEHPGNFRREQGNIVVLPPTPPLGLAEVESASGFVTSKDATNDPEYAKTLASLAFVRISIPDMARAYYRAVGEFPAEGSQVQIGVMKEEEPFDVRDLAMPKYANSPFKPTAFVFGIGEFDGVERAYLGLLLFRDQWSFAFTEGVGRSVARIALWPGRYTISFAVIKPQGGFIGGIVPNVRVQLRAGEWELREID